MKKLILIIVLVFACQITNAQPANFKFTPDNGIRIDSVAIAHATLINDTLFLFYNHELFDGTQARGVGIATKSSDWLVFDTSFNYFDYEDYFIRYKMPDSTYKKYSPNGKFIYSKSSLTGYNFTADTGARYTAQANDSVFGVSTYISAPDGSVHLFYNTTGQEYIACRHAISNPGNNGMNFNYLNANVFGDSLFASAWYYVDPNSILNPDGSISVYLMSQHGGPFPPAGRTGYIHSFTSYDNGQTFHIDSDSSGDTIRFKFDDYDAGFGFSEKVYSLNDPKVVRLPDGRYRIYISAMLKDDTGNTRYVIVSATSQLTQSVNDKFHYANKFSAYPNPSKGTITIESFSNGMKIQVLDYLGKIIEYVQLGANEKKNINFPAPGIYFIKAYINKEVIVKKIVNY